LRDPIFLIGCAAYALNRLVLKPHFSSALLHNWFNDALLIPCALPPLLLMHRWLGLRKHDSPPTALEVTAHVIGWSALFEWAGPHFMRGTTGDPWDVVAYCVGAVVALTWWRGERAIQSGGKVRARRAARILQDAGANS
jgi:hypothetical protein